MSEIKREFKGVWIPREIWLSKDLNMTEKALLVEIDSLSKLGECFATNKHFAEFLQISQNRVSVIISGLVERGYLENEIIYKKGTKQVDKRVLKIKRPIHILNTPLCENTNTPICENTKGNNTSINNTSINNIKKEIYKEKKENGKQPKHQEELDIEEKAKRFVKPTIKEIEEYVKEKGYQVNAELFHNHYESKGWVVGKSPMKSWKACVRTWQINNSKYKQQNNNLSKPKNSVDKVYEDIGF